MRALYALAALTVTAAGLALVALTRFAELFEDMSADEPRALNMDNPPTHAVSSVVGQLTICDTWPSDCLMDLRVTGVMADVDCLVCLDLAGVMA